MKRAATGLCIATSFALVASVAAQSGSQTPTTTPQSGTRTPMPAAGAAADARDITLTGCLARGADGNFTLTNVQADSTSASAGASGSATPPSSGATGTTGAAGTAGSAGSTAGATGSTGATATAGVNAAAAGSTWSLRGGADLANHVGHRIQVAGKSNMDMSMDRSTGSATTGRSSTGATPGSPTASSSSSAANNARTLEVQSVRMISASCP